ncbi:hypothetical protein NQ315_009784 [Exocentrus adspersus]|uniref:Pyroglutamyl-peptidase 1 n=1 Tax=Exocentrus adspersus TaxID=1586481 RepID=A0AAV8WIG8_9CUCU|nr:hypothetical protein NQ315_009784 [Exocentrus adspersus]
MSDNIIVTGFGPFRNHSVNASWEAVKLLPDQLDEFNIIKKEVPVIYDQVQNNIPDLWKKLNPIVSKLKYFRQNEMLIFVTALQLVVHVGVSSFTDRITIEKCAFRKGYDQCDCSGVEHPTKEACCDGDDCITTGLEVDEICKTLNTCKQIKSCASNNAGRYLCEFIYYTSLNIDRNKTLFVHVPPLDAPYTAKQLAEGLLEIIKCALRQIGPGEPVKRSSVTN